MIYSHLQTQRLEASEGGAEAEVDLTARRDGFREIVIRRHQRLHRAHDVSGDQRRELRAKHPEPRVGTLADVDNFVGNVLALAVTVEPEDEPLRLARLFKQRALDPVHVRPHLLLDRRREEFDRRDARPAVSWREVDLH